MNKLKISPRVSPTMNSQQVEKNALADYPTILPKVDTNLNRYPSPRLTDLNQPAYSGMNQNTKPKLATFTKPSIGLKKVPTKQSIEEITKIIEDAKLVEQKTSTLINIRQSKQSSAIT